MKFRKKPIVIEAVQFTKEMAEGYEQLPYTVVMKSRELGPDGKFPEHMKEYWPNYEGYHKHIIDTLEGEMSVQINDWIIKGVNGEFYPCKPDIFEETYERLPD
jgi:hypothetical protein